LHNNNSSRREQSEREFKMASNVTVQVLGGQVKVLDGVNTVRDVLQKMKVTNYSVAVNGRPASLTRRLRSYEFVSLSPKVKGGGSNK